MAVRLGAALGVAVFLGGCGSPNRAGSDGDADAHSGTTGQDRSGDAGAPHARDAAGDADVAGDTGPAAIADDASFPPALPQVVPLGGPVLTAPRVKPIFYSTDTAAADIEGLLAELTSTTYWNQTTSEYGVGTLTVLPSVTLSGTVPSSITIDEIEQEITNNTTGERPAWGAADPSTVYLIVLPPGTIETEPDFGNVSCCDTYDGYHYEVKVDSVTSVPFAVSCSCPGFDGPDITALQERTVEISHEMVESATDPFPASDPAYVQEDDAHVVWSTVTGGEVADMCGLNDDQYYVPPGARYMVQRSWSNAQAKLTRNPCVPHGTTAPYFNSFPALAPVTYRQPTYSAITTLAVSVPIGLTRVIDVPLYSAGSAGGPWTITAYDYDGAFLGTTPCLTLALDSATGQNGETRHLSITPTMQDATLGGEAFILVSEYGAWGDADFQSNLSIGLVTN